MRERECEFIFDVPPTAKVIWRQGHGLYSHLTTGGIVVQTEDPWTLNMCTLYFVQI